MKVEVFSTQNCSACDSVERYLERNQIEFEKKDVMKHKDIVNKYVIMAVPVIILFNDANEPIKIVRGFKVKELEEMIAIIKK